MGIALQKPLSGAVDGVNKTFVAPEPFKAGSVRLFLNGLVCFDGFTEVDSTTIELDVAPLTGDRVAAHYIVL